MSSKSQHKGLAVSARALRLTLCCRQSDLDERFGRNLVPCGEERGESCYLLERLAPFLSPVELETLQDEAKPPPTKPRAQDSRPGNLVSQRVLRWVLDRSAMAVRRWLTNRGIEPRERIEGEPYYSYQAIRPHLTKEQHKTLRPLCRSSKVTEDNALSRNTALAEQWHPTLNAPLTPHDLSTSSSRSVWWKCDAGSDHEWRGPVVKRTAGSGCPFCSRRRVSIHDSLAVVRPDLAAQWHPTRNERTPEQVSAIADASWWWKCPKGDDHEWQAPVRSRLLNPDCPFCAGRIKAADNVLSAVSPELAAQWHKEKNGSLRPEDVTTRANRSVWWQCPKVPQHVWQAPISTRYLRGTGCPYCAGQKLHETNSLAYKRPDLAEEWHPERNGKLTPQSINCRSQKRVWWQCRHDPEHVWASPVSTRTLGYGCPFCAGQRATASTSLQALRPDLAEQWHPTRNGPLKPSQVKPESGKIVWWQCPVDPTHEWMAQINSRNYGQGCPICGRQAAQKRSRAIALEKKGRRSR